MIQEIEIEKLKNHSANVRKSYENLEELTESIRTQGILQNLTVVPDPSDPGTYLVVIGNCRLVAARRAGLKTLPCAVRKMTDRQQAEVMLMENMQRNDLTLREQAQGFQMVLDLGGTVDDIAEKTGFSKSTVYHRLNIAKLDQEELKKREESDGFQLSIKDMIALEKVKSIEDRNDILKRANSPADLQWRIENKLQEEKDRKWTAKKIEELESLGLKEAPPEMADYLWTDRVEMLQDFSPRWDKDYNQTKEIPEGEWFWMKNGNVVRIMRWAEETQEEEETEEEKAKREAEEERYRKKTEINERVKTIKADAKDYIKALVQGKLEPEHDIQEKAWRTLILQGGEIKQSDIMKFLTKKNYWDLEVEEKKKQREKIADLPIQYAILIALHAEVLYGDTVEYDGTYRKSSGENLMEFFALLKETGFTFLREDDESFIDGTNTCYEKREEDEYE